MVARPNGAGDQFERPRSDSNCDAGMASNYPWSSTVRSPTWVNGLQMSAKTPMTESVGMLMSLLSSPRDRCAVFPEDASEIVLSLPLLGSDWRRSAPSSNCLTAERLTEERREDANVKYASEKRHQSNND